jgi:hypothetical protein
MSDDVVDNESVASSSDDATEAFDDRSEAERQRDEYLDALQRLQAEFENYRKRMTRATDDAATRAAGDIVVKLLPALDAFDYAQAHFADAESDEAKALEPKRADSSSRPSPKKVSSALTPPTFPLIPRCTTPSRTMRPTTSRGRSWKRCCAPAIAGRVSSFVPPW